MEWPTMFWGAIRMKQSAPSTCSAPMLPSTMLRCGAGWEGGWAGGRRRAAMVNPAAAACRAPLHLRHAGRPLAAVVLLSCAHTDASPALGLPPVHLAHDAHHAVEAQRRALRPPAGRKGARRLSGPGCRRLLAVATVADATQTVWSTACSAAFQCSCHPQPSPDWAHTHRKHALAQRLLHAHAHGARGVGRRQLSGQVAHQLQQRADAVPAGAQVDERRHSV